jgi:exosortase
VEGGESQSAVGGPPARRPIFDLSPTPSIAAIGPSRTGRAAWTAFATLAALSLVAFAPTLAELVSYWSGTPEYGHGFLLPPVAAWLLWRDRDALSRVDPRPSAWALGLLLPSLALLLLGEMKLSWFLKPFAFVGTLAALVGATVGLRAVVAALPAFVALLLMCPLPGRVQQGLLLPLKRTAALLATGLLDLTGVPASLDGNLIQMPGIADLWVADACSGIRSLIALATLAVIAGLLLRRGWLMTTILVASAVPIAILVNGLRIWLTGTIAYRSGREAAEGVFHFFEGFALFAVGALLLLGWAALLQRTTRGAT